MEPLKVLSCGFGIQSFTMGVMMCLGDLPMVDLAIHADTGHEIQGTYDFVRRWTPWLEARGLNVVVVKGTRGEIVNPDWGIGSVMIPAFSLDRQSGGHGQIKRQCTSDWKIRPIRRHIRSLLPKGNPKPGAVESWQGISYDEWQRMRTSDVAYITNIYPLVERKITRQDCILYLENHGIEVPPKSACTFCPFHSLNHWRELKRKGGADWEEAVA